ncbi:MAG: hypothetical protein KUG75_04370 [Pseudomonadales bacterium]|nr:hypothetical protein [Pseudomonadales bacterium]
MPKLILRIRTQKFQPVELFNWYVFTDSGILDSAGSGSQQLMIEKVGALGEWTSDPSNVTVLVSSTDVLSMQVSVPGRSRGQIQKALPYVVEEFVAEDIDNVHIAHGIIERGKPVDCSIVSKDLIDSWLNIISASDAVPGLLMLDADAFPNVPQELHIYIGEREVMLRGADLIMSTDMTALQSILAAHLTEQYPIKETEDGEAQDRIDEQPSFELNVHLHGGNLSVLERTQLETICGVNLHWVEHDMHALSESEYLIQKVIERTKNAGSGELPAINLLQGQYRPARAVNKNWYKWRPVAAMALILCGLLLLTETAKSVWIGYKADKLTNESVLLYKDIFKSDRRVTAAGLQRRMAAHLGKGNNEQAGFLNILGRLSKILGTQVSKPKLENLSFNNTRGELTTQILVADFEMLESIKKALINNGFNVEIRTAEQKGELVSARLLLKS